ncbi:unnamed protein product [Caenorhabditis auriculariae]|uniref:Calponin-homology (CH) domain-containing protein n=1 Tax=Caenorhabditis auriculariae TaxID=2777116 RepID=A0A8S1H932_9PELO|nr:unnamed protein product [Caenorhabditis auriculariae]
MAMHGGGRRLDQEEEIIPAIRHDDAEWKIIQQNTFTRWVNNHLQKCGESIQNLETDFSDGLKLIHLAAALSQKNVGKFNKKVSFRSQKLENVSLALNFFQNEENIKIINIDSTHIVDHNKKLILGLIWTLILHYSISMGWIQERNDGQPEETPKQKLLNWIRSRLPGVPLSNFTSDWNDGVALGALVNALAPGSLPDWDQWSPNEALPNTQKAMQTAQDLLQVAPLIAPAELIHPDIDEMSVMTYLSQFPAARPVVIKTKVSAEYRNLDEHPLVGKPTEFQVKLSPEGYKPKLTLRDNEGNEVHSAMTKLNDDFFNVKYTPSRVGPLNVDVSAVESKTFTAQSIPDASRTIHVQPLARLLDYPKRAHVGDELRFDVVDANEGVVEAVVVDATGVDHRLPVLESNSPGNYNFLYTVPNAGLHSLNVFHRKNHIAGSPFPLRVKEKNDFEVWGRGICANGVRVGDKVPVHVQSNDPEENVANANLQIHVVQPDGTTLPVSAGFDEEDGKLTFEYSPHAVGEHAVTVTAAGELVKEHKVDVSPATKSKIRAFGPGLCGGIVNEPSVFHVETNGEADSLAFSIEGPSKADIECSDRGNGAALVSYTPKHDGIYKVNVLAGGDHIQDSPFVLRVHEADDAFKPSAARVTGIEENKPYPVGEKIPFRVDTRLVGADVYPKVAIYDKNLHPLAYDSREITPGIFEYAFQPKEDGKYIADVSLRGVAAPGAPFLLNVSEPVDLSKLKIYGPGVEGPVYSQEPTHFTIDAKQAGPGAVEVALADRFGEAVDIDVLDNRDGSFTVKYTAPKPGAYQLNVIFAGDEISPIEINVKPRVDVSGIRVEGLENDGENTRIVITAPSGRVVEAIIESTETGFRVRFTPSEIGDYTIDVTYQDIPIDEAPFTMTAVPEDGIPSNSVAEAEYVVSGTGPACAGLVTVTGPGLGPLVAQRPTHVAIDTTRAGFGDIDLFVDGPTRTPLHCVDNQDGILTMRFTPKTPGVYYLRVMFDNEHVPGSPFQIVAVAPILGSPSFLSSDREKTESPFTSISSGSPTPQTARCGALETDGVFHFEVLNSEKFRKVLAGSRLKPKVDLCGLEPEGKGLELTDEVNGKLYSVKLNEKPPGVFSTNIPLAQIDPKDGRTRHDFKLHFDDVLVKEAKIDVVDGTDVNKCDVQGDGLKEGVVGEISSFHVDLDGAGSGELNVEIKGPSKADPVVRDNGNGTCFVDYCPTLPGNYEVGVLFGDKEKQHVKGSPYHVTVDHPKNIDAVKVDGLDNAKCRVGEPISFKVDASHTKLAPVTARTLPIYQQPIIEQDPKNPRVFYGKFVPIGDAGVNVPIEVLCDGEPVPGSPFPVRLLPETEPENVKFGSYGSDVVQHPVASNDAVVEVDTRDCGVVKDVRAEVVGPDGKPRKTSLTPSKTPGVIDLTWPTDVSGEYSATVYINGKKVPQTIFVNATVVGTKSDVVPAAQLACREVVLDEPIHVSYVHPGREKANFSIVAQRPDAVKCDIRRSRDPKSGDVKEELLIHPTKEGPNVLEVYYGGNHVDTIEYDTLSKSQYDELVNKKARADDVEQYEKRYEQPVLGEAVVPNGSSPLRNGSSSSHSSSSGDVDPKALFPREFKFNLSEDSNIRVSQLEAIVMPPSKKQEAAEIIDNHDGTILVKYSPKVFGSHELSILQNGAQLQGTPIKFFVDSYGDGYATVYGPGLQNAVVGEPAAFTVCAKGSHAKEVSVSIEGPAQSAIKIHDNKDGTCAVTWVPPVPGEYKVHVLLGGKDVHDSPFTVLVMGEGQKRAHLSVGSTSEVALNIAQGELKGISASIKSPSGIEEPCFVRLIDGGRLGVSFTPREVGEHLITVKRDGKLVPKAPFKIKVDKNQVGDASKVEVSGPGKSKAISLQPNEILIDTTKAGYGGLSISVQGPSKAELTCKEVKAGLIKVIYTPTEPGVYAIAIKFADHHVRDSPLTVNCSGKGAGRVVANVSRRVEQTSMSLPGQESLMFLKLPNTSPMDINARIMDPKGHNEFIEMRDLGDQYYQIRFTPSMEGVHTLSVMHKDAHVNGSPFQFTVGSFNEGGAHKVRAAGQGVVRGETGHKNTFNVYSREAGPGNLSVTVEGPSKANIEFHEHKDGNCHVEYKVAQPGEYIVAVKFNDGHIPDSPFKVFIAPATGEVRKLELASFHDQGIPVGKAFTFTVLTHRAKGHLEGKLVAPNNEIETIDIVPIEDGESYALRFVPKETGNHYIHVTLDGAPMRDSPFRLRVGGTDVSDPTAVSASGEGLVKGATGQKCEFIISTVNAGAGILQVQMDGPSKVTLDAYELEKGYKVRYTPLAPGEYFSSIKYNGVHIPGSPFKIPVEGKVLGGNGYNETSFVKIDALSKTLTGTVAVAPEYHGDASKVTAKGAGLNKFFPGRPAAFQIDTGLAGQDLLMVGVVTARGPCEEVVVRHQGNGQYVCTYRVPDRVKGFVFIRYGDQQIPGSPFAIHP